MGDPGNADTSIIPDCSLLNREDVYMRRGELNYAANYNLINANLLDLSHVAFVHEKTIGRNVQGDDGPNVLTGAGAQPLPKELHRLGWVQIGVAKVMPAVDNHPIRSAVSTPPRR